MQNILKILVIILIYFIPAVLFFSLIVLLYIQAVLSSFFEISFILFITFYAFFYLVSFWRKLEICFISFFAYALNNLVLLLQLFTIYYTYFILNHKIFLQDLSIFSQYRYLFICLSSVIVLISILLFYFFNPQKPEWLNNLFYPYMKIHIFDYLITWEESFFGDFCHALMDKLLFQPIFKYCYILVDVFTSTLYRGVILYHFICFCFFQQALNILLYLMPISLFIWLIRFIFESFSDYVTRNRTFTNQLVLVQCKKSFKGFLNSENSLLMKNLAVNDFLFTLSNIALNNNYSKGDLPALTSSWFKLNKIYIENSRYLFACRCFSVFIFIIYIFSYYYIVYKFFISA